MPAPSVLLGLTGLRIDGGIASVSRCVARALDEEVRADRLARTDRVLLLEDPAEAAAGPACGEQRLARGRQARFAWQLWRSFRRHRHDLVFFDLVGLARSIVLPLPGFPPPRSAIFVHGIELSRAREGARARALASAHTLLANSEFTARQITADHPALAARVRVVPLCIDPARVEGWAVAERAPEPPREPAALIVGRMASEERGKGHDELIEAWPAVRRSVPAAELWIAGGGNDVARLQAKAQGLGLGAAVRFLGRVPDAELAALYRRASVYAMPSRQEGFGLAYAEAAWFGLACLGSTADAAGEVILDGSTGLLVPYGDVRSIGEALVALLSDPAHCRALGEAATRHARERFGYARFRRDLLAALELG